MRDPVAGKVRGVRRADRDEWLRMRARLWPEHPENHPREIDAFLLGGGEGEAVLVVERPHGGLAGFVELSSRAYAEGCRSSPVAYLEGWWVDPDARAEGLGRALVAAAEEWARARGLSELASDADLANLDGQRAHAALGFGEVGRQVCFRKAL